MKGPGTPSKEKSCALEVWKSCDLEEWNFFFLASYPSISEWNKLCPQFSTVDKDDPECPKRLVLGGFKKI